jgi:hypothetical protein
MDYIQTFCVSGHFDTLHFATLMFVYFASCKVTVFFTKTFCDSYVKNRTPFRSLYVSYIHILRRVLCALLLYVDALFKPIMNVENFNPLPRLV